MRERMKNTLLITVSGADLTLVRHLRFRIKQLPGLDHEYLPEILSPTEMIVRVPLEDGMRLKEGTAELQFAFEDADGTDCASEVAQEPVRRLLWEGGYHHD